MFLYQKGSELSKGLWNALSLDHETDGIVRLEKYAARSMIFCNGFSATGDRSAVQVRNCTAVFILNSCFFSQRVYP